MHRSSPQRAHTALRTVLRTPCCVRFPILIHTPLSSPCVVRTPLTKPGQFSACSGGLIPVFTPLRRPWPASFLSSRLLVSLLFHPRHRLSDVLLLSPGSGSHPSRRDEIRPLIQQTSDRRGQLTSSVLARVDCDAPIAQAPSLGASARPQASGGLAATLCGKGERAIQGKRRQHAHL